LIVEHFLAGWSCFVFRKSISKRGVLDYNLLVHLIIFGMGTIASEGANEMLYESTFVILSNFYRGHLPQPGMSRV
jgi:hypothetical protein